MTSPSLFGQIDGHPVREAILSGPNGLRANVIEWGGVLRDLMVPTASGPRRVVLGFEHLEDYVAYSPNFGATCGRSANRIAGGRFELDGKTVEVDRNIEDRDHLHGGRDGFGRSIWSIREISDDAVTLELSVPDGHMGYPGACTARVRYQLLAPATLRVEMTATVDRPSPVNLVHHSYFNLDSAGAEVIDNHQLVVMADHFTPLSGTLTPTGEIRSVAATAYDFRQIRRIGLTRGDGAPQTYDINFVLRRPRDRSLFHAATLTSPGGDLVLQAHTTQPGLQIYDGNKVSPPVAGLNGVQYGPRSGFCLETQNFPDAVNHPHFPDPILPPGANYHHIVEYRFSAS